MLLEDSRISLDDATALQKFKIINDHSIISQKPRSQGLTISPANLLVVMKEISEEKAKAKKVARAIKKVVVAPKKNANRKLIIQNSDL